MAVNRASRTMHRRAEVKCDLAALAVRALAVHYGHEAGRRNAERIVEKHLLPKFGDRDARDLTASDIAGWRDRMARSGCQPKTCNNRHTVLAAVLAQGVREGALERNVAAEVPYLPLRRAPPPRWDRGQVARFLAVTKQRRPELYVPLLLVVRCGLRVSRVLRLRERDIDFERREVLGVHLPEDVALLLAGRVASTDRPLTKTSPSALRNHVRRIARTLGLPMVSLRGLLASALPNAPSAAQVPDSPGWLAGIPDSGARAVFQHLHDFGSVSEDEAAHLLGGPRALRAFALRVDDWSELTPFTVFVEQGASGKRYVRGGASP
ncbi:MAG: tyrosine-type recombinase/integrase [Myxococcota bacterium]